MESINVKYIIVGDSTTGKSSMLLQFTDKRFKQSFESSVTIGVEFGSREVQVKGRNMKIQVWDTAGQEKFRSVTRTFFRNAACALVVYDISNRASFDHISMWLDECRSSSTNEHLVIVVIGNKSDLGPTRRAVSRQEGEEMAAKYGLLIEETSAKTGENVDAAFLMGAERIIDLIDNEDMTESDMSRRNSGITIERAEQPAQGRDGKGKGCCG